MAQQSYFGDIRDEFDDAYSTAASFVMLPHDELCSGRHIAFHTDFGSAESRQLFAGLCYAYEDCYDWDQLPLIYLPDPQAERILWKLGPTTIHELPLKEGIPYFHDYCKALLATGTG
jgi:hypothetical protein